MLKNLIGRTFNRLFCTSTKAIQAPRRFSQQITKARAIIPLYKLEPCNVGQIFIAPNATIAGQVYLGNKVSIGHGTVIRGDINSVYIHGFNSIGDNCVLHTAPSLPTGLPAELTIKRGALVSPGCTLYSCFIDESAFIGANSVILEGAIIEPGAIILPNSVVPPGRVVPANQVWGGNPIKFIRFARQQQKYVTMEYAQTVSDIGQLYKQQFLSYNNAYLYKPSDPQNDKIRSFYVLERQEQITKSKYNPENPTV